MSYTNQVTLDKFIDGSTESRQGSFNLFFERPERYDECAAN
jgi:hypothetical protein